VKKLINGAADYVDESLDGLCTAFPGYRRTGRSARVIVRQAGAAGRRVGVVTGDGFGHLLLFPGYVGEGLLTSCAVGDVFAGPPADVCGEAIHAADGGAGVLCVLGNYGGDRMSFGLASDEINAVGLQTGRSPLGRRRMLRGPSASMSAGSASVRTANAIASADGFIPWPHPVLPGARPQSVLP
jgi:dihydroxyacetone kinase-like protein